MKKHILFSLYLLFLVTIGIVVSCKNKNFKDHVGPSICASDNFQYINPLKIDSANKDLKYSPARFTAKFNEEVPWTILITGLTSKSYKKLSGYGSSVDVLWQGNPDTLAFFTVEQCKVVFTVACKDPVVKYFSITKKNSFSNFNYLSYDGDGGGKSLGPYSYGSNATNGAVSGMNSPQGGNCFCTSGNSGTTPVWYFGGFDLPVLLGSSTISSDPTKVYFNCFVNVKGSTTTIPVVLFTEGAAKRSMNLNYHGNGWYYAYFKLSELGVINPRNISTVSFTLNSYPIQATGGDMCLDFVTFTNDTPFISTAK